MKTDEIKKWLKKGKEFEDEGSFIVGVCVVAILFVGSFWLLSKSPFFAFLHRQTQENVVDISPTVTPITIIQKLPDTPELYQKDNQWYVKGLPAEYVVQTGDSTWKIAQAIYGSGDNFRDIESANQLSAGSDLNVGQNIVLPDVASKKTDGLAVTPQATSTVIPTPVFTSTPTNTEKRTHKVQTGEGLWQIAQKYYNDGYQYMKIYEANRDKMKSPEDIRVGMELNIP